MSEMQSMNWKSIRLELGSTGKFPAGSVSRAYLIRLPLDDRDVVDRAAVRRNPTKATVRRHWATEPDERGILVQAADNWVMPCEGKPDRLFELDGTPVRLGAQVAIIDCDGTTLPFKVASIR